MFQIKAMLSELKFRLQGDYRRSLSQDRLTTVLPRLLKNTELLLRELLWNIERTSHAIELIL